MSSLAQMPAWKLDPSGPIWFPNRLVNHARRNLRNPSPNMVATMRLSFDEANILALLLERKRGSLNDRELALYRRVHRYFALSHKRKVFHYGAYTLRAVSDEMERLQTEYEKDHEEDKEGLYR